MSKPLGKEIIYSITILFFVIALTALIPRPDVLRLHVVASSDQPEDQAVKLKVRDAILDRFAQQMQSAASLEQAYKDMQENLPAIEQTASEELRKSGFNNEVTVKLGVRPFPDRQYGDQVYPSGIYQALSVYIGPANGENWWCVMFPPLCVASYQEEPVPDSSAARENTAVQADPVPEKAEEAEPVVLRSRVMEWVQGWWPF